MSKALYLEDVSLRLGGRRILSEINMTVERGEIVAICGTAGSGKAYLPPLLTGTCRTPYTLTGRLFVDNIEIERLDATEMRYARMANVAVLPQKEEVADLRMTALQYVLAPFHDDIKKSNTEILQDTKRIMQLLGLANPDRILKKHLQALRPHELRAVLYAAALSTDPAVAVFSPTEKDIFAQDADELYPLLIKVCKIKKIALLLLTANISFARQYGESVYVIQHSHLWKLDAVSVPHAQYLEKAAALEKLVSRPQTDMAYLQAKNVVIHRGMSSLTFTLHACEILGVAAQHGSQVFCKQKKPHSGSVLFDHNLQEPRTNFMCLSRNTVFPPYASCWEILQAFSSGKMTKESLFRLLSNIGLPTDYENLCPSSLSLYETFRFGLVCAAAASAKVILLEDIDLLHDNADKYDILHLLQKICHISSMGAIVFSTQDAVLHAIDRVQ